MDKQTLFVLCLAVLLTGVYAMMDNASAIHGSSLSQPCYVRIQGSMLPVLYDDQPRNNPDGTFYPGDSFYYLIWFSASPTCVGMRVAPLKSTDGIDVGNTVDENGAYVDPDSREWFMEKARDKCKKTTTYSGCVFGQAIINNDAPNTECPTIKSQPDENPEPHTCITTSQNLKQTVTGLKKVCYLASSGKIRCYIVPIVRTITLVPDIINARINVVLNEETLTDTDGYDARNLDGTYYVWDPITVKHIPHMKWKDQRNNTLHFEIQRYSDVRLENNWDCHDSSCDVLLQHQGFIDSRWDLGNGDGLAVFNATDYSYLGMQPLRYDVTAYNVDLKIANDKKIIDALVVRYDPKYSQYPYSLLSDDMRTAYENRAAVALHYFGSLGGGSDDTKQLHEDRRSKINDFFYVGFGFDPWLPVLFHDALTWSDAKSIDLEDQHRIVQNSRYPDAVKTESPDIMPCHMDPDTAMMVRAGYCKLYFDYPILNTVLGPEGPRYENATLFNTVISSGFGGKDVTFLSHYEYRFSEAYFNTNLHIVSMGYNNTINPVPLSVNVSAINGDSQAQLLTEYLYEKTVYDTRDPGFANITSGDSYTENYSESDTGEINIKLRRIMSKFETYQTDKNQNLAGLEIEDLARLYFDNSKSARLDVPMDVGLGALSPVSVNITAHGTTRQYNYNYVNFVTENEILLNVAQDNTLKITRYPGSITVTPDPGFGQITKLYADGRPVNVTCGRTCTLSSSDDSKISITAENSWGGLAEGTAPEFIPERSPGIRAFDPAPLALFGMAILPIYWIYSRLRRG